MPSWILTTGYSAYRGWKAAPTVIIYRYYNLSRPTLCSMLTFYSSSDSRMASATSRIDLRESMLRF